MPKNLRWLACAALAGASPSLLHASEDPEGGARAPLADWISQQRALDVSVSGYVAGSYYASNGYPSNIHQFDEATGMLRPASELRSNAEHERLRTVESPLMTRFLVLVGSKCAWGLDRGWIRA